MDKWVWAYLVTPNLFMINTPHRKFSCINVYSNIYIWQLLPKPLFPQCPIYIWQNTPTYEPPKTI